MLDKSVPYKHIIMEIEHQDLLAIPEPSLPEGFSFCFFNKGMEEDWARIEASVLEFETEGKALAYFQRDYLPFEKQLEQRCLFIKDKKGLPVATATAWFSDSQFGYQASLHWVAVHPSYQGLGLGKALIQKVNRLFVDTDKGQNVILHTQTWSHRAVRGYLNLGYHFSTSKKLVVVEKGGEATSISGNDYKEALEVLKMVFSKDLLDKIVCKAK